MTFLRALHASFDHFSPESNDDSSQSEEQLHGDLLKKGMEIKLLGLLWDVVQRKPLQLTPVFERLATETSKLIDVELVRMAKYYNYSSSRKSKVVLSIILEESVHGIASTSSIWFTERVCASGASLILTHGPLMSNHQNNKKQRRQQTVTSVVNSHSALPTVCSQILAFRLAFTASQS